MFALGIAIIGVCFSNPDAKRADALLREQDCDQSITLILKFLKGVDYIIAP